MFKKLFVCFIICLIAFSAISIAAKTKTNNGRGAFNGKGKNSGTPQPLADTTPPIPPVLQKAILSPVGSWWLPDVSITWYASVDEGQVGGTIEYEIWRAGNTYWIPPNNYDGPYYYEGTIYAIGAPTYTFIDSNAGDDSNNYFYEIRAVDAAGNNASSKRAAKFIGTVPEASPPHLAKYFLVSFPLVQWNESVETVLQTVNGLYAAQHYDASDKADPWKHYVPTKPAQMNDLTHLDHKDGFFIKTNGTGRLITAGLVPESTTIHLYEGWNMVSYPSFIDRTVDDALTGIQWNSVSTYDPDYRALGGTDLMKAGYGYWIHVSQEADWTITN